MQFSKPEKVNVPRLLLGEGPCWVESRGEMWFVDILGKALTVYSYINDTAVVHELPLMPGTVAPMSDGRALLALEDGFYSHDIDCRKLEQIALIRQPGIRFNDGKCSPDGRFFAGSMDHREVKRLGTMYRMDADLNVTPMFGNIGISNGLCWFGGSMYYIDTMSRTVDVFDYDAAIGELANRRTLITFDADKRGNPDGMTVDSDGNLYVAEWGGSRVSVWRPDGTHITDISVPAKCASCPAFGPDGDLYITTARNMDDGENAGYVYKVRTDMTGVPAAIFAQNSR